MVEIELTLIVLLDFYSTVWLENPGKFPKLKNQLTADRVRKHGEKASFHEDFIILIQQYVLFYYKQSVTNIFGKNAKRAIAKIIKGGTSILSLQAKNLEYGSFISFNGTQRKAVSRPVARHMLNTCAETFH